MAEAQPPEFDLQLLAAPRLLRGDGVVHVGSRKAMAILAVLALDGDTARSRLTALFWPDADAASGRRNLRRELFRLRELGLALAEAADGGLALGAGIEVDADIDAGRLAAGDALPAAGGLALEGLDGIGSVDFDAWLQVWRDRLADRVDRALQAGAERCERGGDIDAALRLRERAFAADPLHEGAAVHVMRLRAARGDRAGALQAFRQLAEALRSELDIAPGDAARALAETLRDGPASATPLPPPPTTVAAGVAVRTPLSVLPAQVPYIARRDVEAKVDAAWQRRQRVYLHGPAGSGKTRLASELAGARGPWLRVACEPQDGELPYSSLVRVLRALRESASDVVLPPWVQRELSQVMPELGAPPQPLATDEARQRLLAAAAAAWRLLMADNFSAFVLDDWHWGDPASVELWSRLDDEAPAGDGGIAWIVAYRSAQLAPAALAHQRFEIDRGRGADVALGGMAKAEVLSLTHALSGAAGGTLFSQRLHAATEGNPFFLLETLRHLFEQGLLAAGAGGWSTPFDEQTTDYAELPVPASVRGAVLARVRALGAPVQRLLEVASLCSGDIDPRLLASAGTGAPRQEDAVVAALEHAEAAQLVEPAGSGWRFAHDLVRQSLAQGLGAARRRLAHERLALQLERMAAAPALIAAHWEAAERRGDAVRWRVAAAESAARIHASADALAHYAHALADGAAGAAAARIHRAVAHLHAGRLQRAEADAAFAAGLDAAAADPVDGAAEALRTQLDRADHLRETDRVDASLALLDSLGHDLAGADPARVAQALGARASILLRTGRHNEGEQLFREAVDLLAGRPDARAQTGALLLEHTRLCIRRGDLDGARALGQRAVVVLESIDAPIALAQSLIATGVVFLYSGETAQARAALERARALARRCGDVPAQRGAILNLVKMHTDGGETDAAVALLDEGEALAPAFEHRRSELAFREARYFVHYLRGEVAAARAAAERLLDFADDVGGAGARARIAPRALDRLERIGAVILVVDLFLLTGELQRATELLQTADVLCEALRAAGEGNHYAVSFTLKQAWLALAEGRPADALARLPAAEQPRLEDRCARAWIGAAAARRLGDSALAERFLAVVDVGDEVSTDQFVPWLCERLALADAGTAASEAAVARGRALLASGRVPGLFVAELAAAVARHRPGG